MNRLFIGLPVDLKIIEKLNPVLVKLSSCKDTVKTVSPAHMHITMKFLGSTDSETESKILQILPDTLKKHAPLSYDAVGLGAFPSIQKASVLWCGIKSDTSALLSLHGDIEKAMESLGFIRETRAFSPHITVARIRKGSNLPPPIIHYFQNESMTRFGSSLFNKIILFKSDLTSEGPHYTELFTIRLGQKGNYHGRTP